MLGDWIGDLFVTLQNRKGWAAANSHLELFHTGRSFAPIAACNYDSLVILGSSLIV